ncbi:MAG: LacI family DNA-binding transcriptional regulator [Lentisphaeria bacterium]|nr:LacI family DNA-binding transcriptional regulator [Lentisphaeria bacterium]
MNTVKKISLSDVARHCGVSVATAGQILNSSRSCKFKKETVELVRQTAAKLNYRPNIYASALRKQENRIILCIVGDSCRHSDMEHLKLLEHELGQRGYNLLIQFLVGLPDESKLDFLEKTINFPAGIAIWSLGFSSEKSMERFCEIFSNAPPTISMTAELPGTSIDHIRILWGSATIKLAVEHFASLKFHRVGCCCNALETKSGASFLEAADALGLEGTLLPCQSRDYFAVGRAAARKIAAMPQKLQAVYCTSDEAAFSMIEELRNFNIKVPADIYLLGGGDSEFCRHLASPLPVLLHDIPRLCRTAAEDLTCRIKQGEHQAGTGRCIAEIGRRIYERKHSK